MNPLWQQEKHLLSTAFKENGFVHIEKFFDPSLCEDAINSIQRLENSLTPSNSVNIVTETIDGKVLAKYYQGIYSEDASFRKFFSHSLLELASCLLGTSELYFADIEAHLRNPGGGEIPKHQDNFYFSLTHATGLTVYVALSEHDKTSGGLNYLARSHSSVLEHSLSSCPGFSSFIQDESLEASSRLSNRVYSPSYKAGDISVHHPNNIHWSYPSPPNSQRGFALSVRVFSLNETIDPAGQERYRKLLSQNRSN